MAVEVLAERRAERPPRRRGRAAPLSLHLLAAVPFVLAVVEAFRSPRLNYGDFWLLLGRVTTPTGELRPAELFVLHNDHPAVLVSLLFWLDAKLFDGQNWPLSLFSVLMALAIFGCLVSMLPPALTGTKRAAVVAALSALTFSSAATEYFGIGMSGAHWLLGLTPAVVAIALAHRGHTLPAAALGAIACLGHGAGFPVWAALALVAWLRRDRLWRVVLPVPLGVVVLVVWYLAGRGPGYPGPFISGPDTYLSAALTTLGQVWAAASADFALAGGTLTAGLLAVLLAVAVRERLDREHPGREHPGPERPVLERLDQERPDRERLDQGTASGDPMLTVPALQPVRDDRGRASAGWHGLAAHMVLAATMIGLGRGRYGAAEGLAPRYAGIALLALAALVVLLAARAHAQSATHVVAAVLTAAVATYAIGATWAVTTRNKYPLQPVLAVAMRLQADSVILKNFAYPQFTPVLRAMGVYPFTDDFTLGCGGPELGSRIDLANAAELPPPGQDQQTSGAVESGAVTGGTEVNGWAMVGGRTPDCVLVTDRGGTVVGGGAVGLPRRDVLQVVNGTGRAGWRAVAGPGTEDGVVLVASGGRLYRITTVLGG
ncbi:hypothetical protein [Saccharothrix lopnurensis]|uniref:Integral membrane protein n=1 Tax=Saccharothrix lopnurensis TaxID=1670621 RepID=A0ABW1NYB7_9PSEU